MGARIFLKYGETAWYNFRVCLFFGIEMSFLWYRGGRSLLFGIEISFLVSRFCISVVQHLYRPLLGINLSVLLWASTSCKVEVKEDLDTEKKT